MLLVTIDRVADSANIMRGEKERRLEKRKMESNKSIAEGWIDRRPNNPEGDSFLQNITSIDFLKLRVKDIGPNSILKAHLKKPSCGLKTLGLIPF